MSQQYTSAVNDSRSNVATIWYIYLLRRDLIILNIRYLDSENRELKDTYILDTKLESFPLARVRPSYESTYQVDRSLKKEIDEPLGQFSLRSTHVTMKNDKIQNNRLLTCRFNSQSVLQFVMRSLVNSSENNKNKNSKIYFFIFRQK